MKNVSSVQCLAFDLGAESGRAVLGSFNGESLQLEEVHRFPNTPVWVMESLHWDVLHLWEEIKEGLRVVVLRHAPQLTSLGVDTWGVDFGLLASDDTLIGNPYHYRDHRTDGMLDKAFLIVPKGEIYRSSGIQFMQLNSLYQLFYMALNHSPQLEQARTFLNMPDLFNFWLSGHKVNERTIASTTQFLDAHSGNWAKDILQKMGIPTDIFGEVVPSATILGEIRPSVAKETSCLHKILVVAPGCHDTASAVAAAPLTTPDALWLSSGTWSIIGVELSKPIITESGMAAGMTNEGGVENTFRLCKNIVALWLVQECRRQWQIEGTTYTYDDLTRLAQEAQPFVSLINTGDARFLAPSAMPARIQTYCQETGQKVPYSHSEILRCVFESLALEYRRVAESLDALVGHRLTPIHVMGGGSRNDLLNQFTANATNRLIIAGPTEATAAGNILTQLVALGKLKSISEGREMIRHSVQLKEFTPERVEEWEAAFTRYINLPQ